MIGEKAWIDRVAVAGVLSWRPQAPGAKSEVIDWAPKLPPPESASLLTKMGRLRRELAAAYQAGLRITPKAERMRRSSICDACPYWSKAGNLHLGECRAPGCGCTRAKVWIASSWCPLPVPKWGPV